MNFSILIGTCDSYLEYMPNSMTLLDKYLPAVTKVVVGETEKIDRDGYRWVLPGKAVWGKRMIEALKTIDTEFVFFITYWEI